MNQTKPIESYALIGNLHTAALVDDRGSIDWLCLPRFDGAACFTSLLGTVDNGRWLLAPEGRAKQVRRRYLQDTLILETEYDTAGGQVSVVDFMPCAKDLDRTDVVRLVRGRSGKVAMQTEIVLRFDYGRTVPWVRHIEDGTTAIAGPDALVIRSPVRLKGEDFRTTGRFEVSAGESVSFVLTRFRSHLETPPPIDVDGLLDETEQWWTDWAGQCGYQGKHRDAVVRSLITLKALTYAPTGGIVAAPTTSLPEAIGRARNWDYRYCWVRDATFTLYALLISGYREEAAAWREWLLRAVAGSPSQLQPLFGVAGERQLNEWEVPWLQGYAKSSPVRVGNAASSQIQLDVYGELMDAFHLARSHDIDLADNTWELQQSLLEFLEGQWNEPDRGIWEIRGPPRQLTHSKVMAWVAMDRAVKAITRFGLPGQQDRWAVLRDQIHADVCEHGFDAGRNSFVQYYGGKALDGALLMLPMVGFLRPEDPRIVGTVEAIRKELVVDGLVRRYQTEDGSDGLAGGEGAFLPCSFWLADNLAMAGRNAEAEDLFERLLSLRNDLGLLAEEYDTSSGHMLGNFPQAFSHIAMINTAYNLARTHGPSRQRSQH